MGPKKRNRPPRSKPPLTVNVTNDLRQEQSKIEPLAPSDFDSIRLQSDLALNALDGGNKSRALKIMKEACLRYKNSALVYRAQANVQHIASRDIIDKSTKLRHLKNALESARRAVSLSPKSLEFANFYASFLYNLSICGTGYEEVVRECERALSIDDPIDPATETSQNESHSNTAEERIAHMRESLQALVQRCKIASLPPSTENLENLKALNTPEKNLEIKTPEKQRREIDNAVAAAMPLEQESISEVGGSDVNMKKSKLAKRLDDAARKMNMMRTHQLLSYWKSMSAEERRGFLEFRICDLEVHFGSVDDGLAENIFSEAIGFVKKHKTWNFWPCCFCDEKFNDSELRMQHFDQKHNKSKLRYVDPQEVDANWVCMLVNDTWKPVDTREALKIIEEQSNSPSADLVSDSDVKWPLSDNVEREKILQSIYDEFRVLLRNNCLSKSNLEKVIKDSMDELHKQQLHIHGLDQIPLSICFLEVPQLEKILKFLHVVSNLCGLNKNPDMDSSLDDELDDYEIEEIEIKEMIAFNGDGSAETCTIRADEVDVLPDSDALRLEREFDIIETWRRKKSELENQKEALLAIESICIEELEKRKLVEMHIPQRYASLLSKRQKELDGADNGAMSQSSRFELDAISSIHTEVQNVDHSQFEALLTSISSLSSDSVDQEDACITDAIHRQIDEEPSTEFSKLQASVMRICNVKRPLGVLVDKDTKKKADAAKEALLSEIELEAKKKNLESKKKNKKQRKKKDPKVAVMYVLHALYKFSLILTALQVTQGDELYVLQEETEEQPQIALLKIIKRSQPFSTIGSNAHFEFNLGFRPLSSSSHFPVSYDADYPSSEIVVAARADELGLQEEKLKHEIEHDVEERKLKEKLEYQRQIAEEDTNLAKQNKDAVASTSEELEEMDVACSTDLGPGLRNVGENNCFINVIVQSLWHLRTFRGKFLRRSTPAHVHIKDPCIVCELRGIFIALREAKEGDDAVSPTTLRIALSKWQDCNFQEFFVGRVLKYLHVCYGLEHCICFVYNRAKENWIVYDDDKVKGSVPVTPLEETKEPDNPWKVRKAGRKRSGNHGKAKQDMDLGDEHPFSHPLQRQSNSVIYMFFTKDNVDLDWLLDNSFFWNTMEKSKFIRKLDDILHVRQKLDSSFLDEYINEYLCNTYGIIAPDCWGSLVPNSGPAWDVYCRFETDIKEYSSDNNSNRLQSVSRKIARYMRNLFEHANSSFPVHMRVKKERIVQKGYVWRDCWTLTPWCIMKFLLSEVDY
ncbi:hypothetical protein HYC85_002189 [Camellia sinensis]|uniref:C2H2-type domain-containing protein n=1 Tax=Camellia sinensis TaxID=4442 RepID=A0A7J7I7I4_CAMSI|nr:hypothetical protein HYC85_002189 [Camellia sinensis]